MMNAYLRTIYFTIDGNKKCIANLYILVDENEAKLQETIKGKGKTFESLYNFMSTTDSGLVIRGNCYEHGFFSKKRRIEFYDDTIKNWIDNGIEREWKLSFQDKPRSLSMKKLMELDADKVIQYLVERGLTLAGVE